MMPGMGKMARQVQEAGFDDKMIARQVALIQSMTKRERANPALLQASRKKRIAKGAGQDVSDLNKLLKMHRQMADMMKKLGKKGGRGMLRQALGGLTGKGGAMPDMNDPRAMEEAAKALGGKLPGGPGGGMGLPPGLSGFGKKK
jgi:signal recognition particle subunit SRP54